MHFTGTSYGALVHFPLPLDLMKGLEKSASELLHFLMHHYIVSMSQSNLKVLIKIYKKLCIAELVNTLIELLEDRGSISVWMREESLRKPTSCFFQSEILICNLIRLSNFKKEGKCIA